MAAFEMKSTGRKDQPFESSADRAYREIGAPFVISKVTKRHRWTKLLEAIGAFLLAGFLLTISLFESQPWILLPAVGILVFTVWSFITYQREKSLEIRLHQHGLVYHSHKGTATLLWDDVRSVRAGIMENRTAHETHYTLAIRSRSGHNVTIETTNRILKEIGLIHNTVQREVSNRLLPRVLTAFRAGRTLDFGSLLVNRQGLRLGKKRITWPEVEDIDIKQGVIRVKKRNGWRNWVSINVGSMPNALVFLGLADQVLHTREFSEIRRPQ